MRVVSSFRLVRIALRTTLLCLPLLAAGVSAQTDTTAAKAAFFEQQIRPILTERCFSCHSGKGKATQGGLSLADRAAWLRGGNAGPAVIPGKPEQSRLITAIQYNDPSLKMPPSGKLSDKEIELLTEWVRRGAPGPQGQTPKKTTGVHWAFRPILPVAPPKMRTTDAANWAKTPVDQFILAGLEKKGLTPGPAADRRTLIRRVYFDLIGLPPSPEAIQAYLKDNRPDAYERLIDRLLASPAYGERWGRHWLDVAHYGDTHGYDKDKRRDHAWPYRDYVIRAFNADKPYAKFVQEQIAGDVLFPDTAEGVIATGFIAAGPWDFVGNVELAEGTIEKEKTRVLDRDDMVSTTIGTFNSLTIHCARCHNHKFDPIPQRDYYRLQAVFAGVERGNRSYADRPFHERKKTLETEQAAVQERLKTLQAQVAAISSPELTELDRRIAAAQTQVDSLSFPRGREVSPANGYHSEIADRADAQKWVQVDLGQRYPIDEIRLFPARPVDFADTPGFGFPVRFQVVVSDEPGFDKPDIVADETAEDYPSPGDEPVVLEGRGKTARYVRVNADRLWKRTGDYVFALGELQVISGGQNVARKATVTALDSIEMGLWSRAYLVDDFDSRHRLPELSTPDLSDRLTRRAKLAREAETLRQTRQRRLMALVPATVRAELDRAEAERVRVETDLKALPTAPMVYAVLPRAPRPVQVLARGDVTTPGEAAEPGALTYVPGLEAVFKLPSEAEEGKRRAALAQWITDPKNMLTWRSIVNRVWHYHFGKGIVDTPNDFGRNGSLPTHPELLDWLAAYFRDNGQSFKKLHKLLLMSAVYQQASTARPECAKVDTDNRLLWRMNRQRLDAEEVRDSILAISGKLDRTMGGPGFEPFRFKDDHSPIYDHTAAEKVDDPATRRRAVYCFLVRSVPNPLLECLDAADPNINTPVRNTTLTALQALALLNDPFVVKQAEYFAERVRTRATDPATQAEVAYNLAFGRLPEPGEQKAMAAYIRAYGLKSACRLLFNANEFIFVD